MAKSPKYGAITRFLKVVLCGLLAHVPDFVIVIGAGLGVYGVSQIYEPAAYIAAGSFCLLVAWPKMRAK